MNVAEELREHVKRVEAGWRRGSPEEPNTACVEFWTDAEGERHALSRAAMASIAEQVTVGRGWITPVTWNDAKPDHGGPVNRRQVAAVLRRAADAWEREQGVGV